MQSCDFLIIGAGIAGASAAYELAAHGKVILAEAEDSTGYHSSGRSAAQFLETYGNSTVRRLTVASRTFYEGPPEGFTEHALLAPRPALYVAGEDRIDELNALVEDVRKLSPDIETLSRDQVLKMVPIIRPEHAAAAAIEPAAMDIDVHGLLQGYLRGLRARGGEVVLKAQVAGLARANGAWQVETRAGAFSAQVVINAAGAWCDEVAALAGVRPVGLVPKRRTAITIDGPEGMDTRHWPLVAMLSEGFYFKPDSGRIFASPNDATPSPPCDAQPDELDVAITVDRAQTYTTLEVRRVEHKWAGLRSFVADESLVIGMDDKADGFFWLAGQGGYGFQTAPAAARCVAGLLSNGVLPEDVASQGLSVQDLSPGRLTERSQ